MTHSGEWRNGRRARFRSVYPKGCGGSTPPSPTTTALSQSLVHRSKGSPMAALSPFPALTVGHRRLLEDLRVGPRSGRSETARRSSTTAPRRPRDDDLWGIGSGPHAQRTRVSVPNSPQVTYDATAGRLHRAVAVTWRDWSKVLNTSSWAFQISSKRTAEYGLRRTASVVPFVVTDISRVRSPRVVLVADRLSGLICCVVLDVVEVGLLAGEGGPSFGVSVERVA